MNNTFVIARSASDEAISSIPADTMRLTQAILGLHPAGASVARPILLSMQNCVFVNSFINDSS